MARILPTRSYLAAYRAVVGVPDATLRAALSDAEGSAEIEIPLKDGGRLVLTLGESAIRASVRGGRFFDDAGNMRPAPVGRGELAERIAWATASSAPGVNRDAAFEASRCLDAIEAHIAEPREGSEDFIARQWAKAAALMGVALEVA